MTQKPDQCREASVQRLMRLIERMDRHVEYSKLLFEWLPDAVATSKEFDASIAEGQKRKRGERGKLHGSVLLEQMAVDLVRARKDHLKEEGLAAVDAWAQAYREVAKGLRVRPSTIESWYRGVQRRERAVPLNLRKSQRRKTYRKAD